jgi:hypothetical protein
MRLFFPDESWPELLGALFQLSQAPEADKRETAFRVFVTTPGIIEKQHESTVLEAFNKGFADDAVIVSDMDLKAEREKIAMADSRFRSVWLPWRHLPPSSAPSERRLSRSTTT